MMSATPLPERDDQLLIRYLVGSLGDEETERLDELSIADDRFAADLHAVEHDLVDAYVRGALVGDTLQRFEMHYLSSPAGRAKVAFARTLLRYTTTRGVAPGRDAAAWRSERQRLVQWSLAAAAIVFLAFGGY